MLIQFQTEQYVYKQSRGVAFFVQRQSKIDTFHDFVADVNGGYALGTY